MLFNFSVIEIYKQLYTLPELKCEEEVSDSFFNLYNRDHFFVAIAIYNIQKQLLIIRDFNKHIGWEIPGGFVGEKESIEDAVNRIVLSETGTEIDELTPIATIKNQFKCQEELVSHFGIAFIALTRGEVKPPTENIQSIFTTEIPKATAYQNTKILEIAREIITSREYPSPPFEEIDSVRSKKFSLLYKIHKYLIKPIGSFSSKKIRREIIKLVKDVPSSVLDASCGDSSVIDFIYKKFSPSICVGNNISWKTISLLKNKNPNVIFTNHNVLNLPFKKKFDLIIFKNTLHHIQRKQQEEILTKLLGLTKQLIVVDINNPRSDSFLSKMWNKYYTYLLGDQGDSFLNYDEFQELIKKAASRFNRLEVDFKIVGTIKGRYFISSLSS